MPNADSLYELLQGANDLLDEFESPSSSNPVSPTQQARNRSALDELNQKMLTRGQVQPLDAEKQLAAVAANMQAIATPTSSQPIVHAAASNAIQSIRRVARKSHPGVIVDDLLDELEHAIATVDAPSGTQPRDPDIMRRNKKKLDQLQVDMIEKQLVPTPVTLAKRKRTKASRPPFAILPHSDMSRTEERTCGTQRKGWRGRR